MVMSTENTSTNNTTGDGKAADATNDAATGANQNESGAWKFQIAAPNDWQKRQTDFLKAVALTIGDRRWKMKKVEKPIGNSKVWKIKAEIQ